MDSNASPVWDPERGDLRIMGPPSEPEPEVLEQSEIPVLKAKSVTIMASVTHPDGTVTDYGIVSQSEPEEQ
jgi:hypothetical protein